jgi:hypothetical protein
MESLASAVEDQKFCDNVIEHITWTEHKRLWLMENKYLLNC